MASLSALAGSAEVARALAAARASSAASEKREHNIGPLAALSVGEELPPSLEILASSLPLAVAAQPASGSRAAYNTAPSAAEMSVAPRPLALNAAPLSVGCMWAALVAPEAYTQASEVALAAGAVYRSE